MFIVFPVSAAYAADPVGGAGSAITGMLPLVLLFVIFYFLLIRPQQKKAKEHKEMLSKIEKGDNVVTSGGLHGRVTSVAEDAVTMEIADNVRVKVSRDAISTRKPQGAN
ncbi:MAG: preprotein translocase subunit YajC [Deltaproteobacteria bacterium]|nr:preprotein translocase subunit YajC [Deltaproteobacteria bacterium]